MFCCSTDHLTDGIPNLSAFGFVGSFKQFSKAAALYSTNRKLSDNKLGSKLMEYRFFKPNRFENFVIVMTVDVQ